MGLEAGNGFITGLVGTNPVGATDPKSQGDDHIRLIKLALLGSFAAIGGAVTLTHTQINDAARQSAANVFTSSNDFVAGAGTSQRIRINADAGTPGVGSLDIQQSTGLAAIINQRANAALDFATNNVVRMHLDAGGTLAGSTIIGVAFSDFARLSQANLFTAAQTITVADNTLTAKLYSATVHLQIYSHDAGSGGSLIRALNNTDAAYKPVTIVGSTVNLTPSSGLSSDLLLNGIAASDYARLSVGNTFLASNTRNSAVGSLFDRWQLSGVDKGYVGVGGGGAIGGLTSSDFGFTSIGGGSIFLGTAGNARLTIDNTGNFDFKAGTVTTNNASASEVGYKGTPPNVQNGNYGIVLADAGCGIFKQSGAGNTITIPANGTIALPIGTVITIDNDSGNSVSIAITTDVLELAGAGTTGTRTLADNGSCTLQKIAATKWRISGAGVS